MRSRLLLVLALARTAIASDQPTTDDEIGQVQWGEAIAAALVVNVITLTGVIFLVPCAAKMRKNSPAIFEALLSAFASGALLATAFFLLLFESVHYVGAGFDDEAQANWRWGTMALAGFLIAGVLDTVVIAIKGHPEHTATDLDIVSMSAASKEAHEAKILVDYESRSVFRVRAGILIGDLMHNFVDGIFLGTAFRYCGAGRGWAIAGSTIIHEVAQECADYVVLTGKRGKLQPGVALLLNFISGMSVLIGALLTMLFEFSNVSVGLLLAMSAGVYIHVAATEAMGSVYQYASTVPVRFACLLLFAIGASLIGIVLIDHGHCQLSDGDDAHAGHNHGRL